MADDRILVKNLVVRTIIGVDSWERIKRQPVTINLCLYTDISGAGASDHVTKSIHYGLLTKAVEKFAEGANFRSVEALAHAIVKICIKDFNAAKATVRLEKPRALLHATSAGVEITRTAEDLAYILQEEKIAMESTTSAAKGVPSSSTEGSAPAAEVSTDGSRSGSGDHDIIFVKDLRLSTIIGVNPWEREEKQVVILNITIHPSFRTADLQADHVQRSHNYRTIVRTISRHVEASAYKTIEAIVTAVARIALEKCHVRRITVRIEKSSALVFAETAGVEITRDRAWLQNLLKSERSQLDAFVTSSFSASVSRTQPIDPTYIHCVYIALGSNMGDSAANIVRALQLLEERCECQVVDTSFLYETPPMYVTNQPTFLNAACKILTALDPEPLLVKLKEIENLMGRVPTIRYGPRPIDLDILFYDELIYSSETLVIPHALIQEREFVLRPLYDIAKDLEHPKLFRTISQLLSQLLKFTTDASSTPTPLHKVLLLRNPNARTLWRWNLRTLTMGILNVTPDSFSDGGDHSTTVAAVAHAIDMISQGADIIDIGGESTRPKADPVSADEELARVIPVIRDLRARGVTVPISIDTRHARVAREAVLAGADLVNDVSGGDHDPEMVPTMAQLNVPVCLMHMRGNPRTMQNTKNTTYNDNDIIAELNVQLKRLADRAVAAGVFRWNIIVDPGLGFAKTTEHDFRILRRLPEILGLDAPLEGFPCLVGPSRKKFIGKVTGETVASKRTFGTAGAVAAGVAGGANIMRVHDVKEMVEVAKVADAVWRGLGFEKGEKEAAVVVVKK
ncbi:Dihydropteroate synthase-like protein [Endogone sp. FLAS-F59071]|nr:Dihydropteroate synthase-like protein [Endogone sp. FLAS-F59071]|eukprot:RUS19188.1 Dihydropteroate synthase-like protein [Endogone sp. FLAS-F59071]